jgi:hypothetical protein
MPTPYLARLASRPFPIAGHRICHERDDRNVLGDRIGFEPTRSFLATDILVA